VRPDEHLAQLDEVAVFLIVDLNHTPGVSAATDLAAIGSSDLGIGTDNSERYLGHDFRVLGDGFLVIKLVAGAFEDLDPVVGNVGKDLFMLV
jgi:hypothetical protein